jgi:hypothetical protein
MPGIPVRGPEHWTGIYLKVDPWTVVIKGPTTYISIDDSEPERLPARGAFFPLYPGRHEVRCFIHRSLPLMGDSSTDVLLPQECVVSLMWRWRGYLLDGRRGQFKIIPTDQLRINKA